MQVRNALGHVARNREERGAPRASLLVHGAAVQQHEQRDLEQLEDECSRALHVVAGDAEHEHQVQVAQAHHGVVLAEHVGQQLNRRLLALAQLLDRTGLPNEL